MTNVKEQRDVRNWQIQRRMAVSVSTRIKSRWAVVLDRSDCVWVFHLQQLLSSWQPALSVWERTERPQGDGTEEEEMDAQVSPLGCKTIDQQSDATLEIIRDWTQNK